MTKSINEQELPPHKFYEALSQDDNYDKWITELKRIYYKGSSADEYLKYFGAKLIKNFISVFNEFKDIPAVNRCTYLNCWTDLEIKRLRSEKGISAFDSKIDNFIEDLWEKLKKDKGELCKRDKRYFSEEHMKLRKDLQDFCAIRDYLIINKNMYSCEQLNTWVNEMYIKYFDNNNCEKYNYIAEIYNKDESPLHITRYCTLYDIHTTFPYFKCNNFESPVQYRIGSIEYFKKRNTSHLMEPPPYEDTTHDHISNPPSWIRMTIVFLSLIGIIFAFFILNKFTPLGFWLRKNIIQSYVTGKDKDEDANTFSKKTSNKGFLNMGKREHYIAYHTS
ncbi:PIR Superfamily Protein [Plasmodium ovale wallikeri]|uniref:PIR protein n=2 Tax=Plasmodium ovale TaxID=36330 RepID=A0A1C3KGQ7_PLAOA|nr:PIR Superfamily Protein [Plasmodium ovale wallikeri]SBT72901.1 PIR protein [Plasmodium ovale]